MRQKRHKQFNLSPQTPDHPMAHELQVISNVLDDNPTVCELVYQDLTQGKMKTGRKGMTAEQVLRCAILFRILDCSYRELAFHLMDSDTSQWFCRLDFAKKINHKMLQENIKRIQASTWEAISRHIVLYAQKRGIEKGQKVRTDTTVVKSNIHHPTDSSLLWDSVRVLTRLLERAKEAFPECVIKYHNHTRGAKRNALKIASSKDNKKKRKAYRRLFDLSNRTVHYAFDAIKLLRETAFEDPIAEGEAREAANELENYMYTATHVIEQTHRRVVNGEKIPAQEKIVSIFETHTDIIKKDNREILFGHKICLNAGSSSMILDCVIEDGNPADSTLFDRSLDRHKALYGRYPRQVAADGGFASNPNLENARLVKGIKNVAFSKKCGLEIEDMTTSLWLYRKLRNFRAGVEGCISAIKRICGLGTCMWRGLGGFHGYVHCSVVAFNLLILARRLLN